MPKLDRTEIGEVYSARLLELANGEISGKEFVASLVDQCDFVYADAMSLWETIKPDIYNINDWISFPVLGKWQEGIIVADYMSGHGAIIQTSRTNRFAARVPFSKFELKK